MEGTGFCPRHNHGYPRCLAAVISADNPVVDLVVYRVSHEKVSILGSCSFGHCEKQNVILTCAQPWLVTAIDLNAVKVLTIVQNI